MKITNTPLTFNPLATRITLPYSVFERVSGDQIECIEKHHVDSEDQTCAVVASFTTEVT